MALSFSSGEDYRLQPQDKGTMIEHHRTPFRLNRARNIAAKIPISTLQCCFSDLRDWLTRTSSHVPPGQVSNEINHGYVGTSISVVHAKKFRHVGRHRSISVKYCPFSYVQKIRTRLRRLKTFINMSFSIRYL